MKIKNSLKRCCAAPAALVFSLGLAANGAAGAQQFTDDQIKSLGESRVAALDVLSGDYGLSGGSYSTHSEDNINVSKFGGMGDIGIGQIGGPAPLGNTGIAWQPRLQGNMGYLTSDRTFSPGTTMIVDGTPYNVSGDKNKYNTFAIQFGGGARFWFNEHLSLAPTIMGMYGNTRNTYDVNGSGITQSEYTTLKNAGLIGWTADTWTVRPAGELSYFFTWGRTIFTLTSAGTYYYTQSFHTTNPNFTVSDDAESWENKLDVDIPLGVQIYHHELRTGGYFSRTDLFGGLDNGLNTGHIYEIHGRVVLDYLNQLWKVQWIGVGISYLWGNDFTGVTYGVDAAFRF